MKLFRDLSLLLLITSLFMVIGCSNGKSPIEPAMNSDFQISENIPISEITSTNILGAYELTIDPDSMTADLTPHRQSAIGESWSVSGLSYFETPTKCFIVSGLAYENGIVTVKFDIKHPFKKGDTEAEPSARNRLDLDIFDLAMVVEPKPLSPINYSLLSVDIPEYLIHNPDGLTNELSVAFGTETALPYVLVVDDSRSDPPSTTYNRFEMGASTEFEAKFPLKSGQALGFDLYLTFGYGFSAVLADRLNPEYYNPEFNRKASWKVEVIPPNGSSTPALGNTWDDLDDSTEYDVTVKVYDW